MLRLEGVNTHYAASHVLQGVDLEMPHGQISAVLGRNGVGITTAPIRCWPSTGSNAPTTRGVARRARRRAGFRCWE